MTSALFNHVTLDIQLPSRWVLGESRLIKMRLRNQCGADLKKVQVRTGWWGAEAADERWKHLGVLRRGAHLDGAMTVASPPGREDQFRLELRAEAGPYLQLELWGAKMDVQARPKPGAEGPVHVVFENSGISGDKIGFGQVASEGGAVVGHQVHLHGSNATAEFERWLAEDPLAAQMRELPLHLALETCQEWTNPHGMMLAGIMRGEFCMGACANDAEAQPEEKMSREVTLTHSFWMARHPVTNAQWTEVMQSPTPVTLKGHRAAEMPVANVTWGQAMDFCTRLTERERAVGVLPPGYAYRLPTEAEWEYACRAGCTKPRYGALMKIGSVQANGGRMIEVGRFEPNAWGLHDMLGLVFEWCVDAYAPYNLSETTDPVCWNAFPGQQLQRVIRGGCYQGPDVFARASARFGRDPQSASNRVGFRVVLARES
ncbi:MAG: SUMF1/EgtB/PvdO family nonheme iron enzyme [Verrucomicrobiaceae bacterium]